MTRFSLRVQLMLLSLVLAAGFLTFGAWTWHTVNQTKVGGANYERIVLYKDLVADILPPPNYIIEAYLTILQLADPDRSQERDALLGKLQQLKSDYDTRHRFWGEQLLPENIRQRFLRDAHEPAVHFFEIADKEFVPAIRANDLASAHATLKKLEEHYTVHRKAIDDVVTLSGHEQGEVEKHTEAATQRDLAVLLLVFLISGALAGVASYLFDKSLLAGIMEVKGRLADIASGKLDTVREPITRADEIGDLLRSVETTCTNLRKTVEEIHAAAKAVAVDADLLSSASTTVAGSTQVQSTSVSGMVATVGQMSQRISLMASQSVAAKAMVQQAGARCDQGSAEISRTSAVVEQLASEVQATAVSMQSLAEHSREISGIVGVIREIADQTNLLALNAAIEAARAGEHGRGFAVVADEVRKHAERTAQSTDRITTMITEIQKGIENAVHGMSSGSDEARTSIHAVQAARATMDAIAAETGTLVGNIQQIAESLAAQRTHSDDIAGTVGEIARGAEENSAAAARVSETAGDLASTASRLRRSVEFFCT